MPAKMSIDIATQRPKCQTISRRHRAPRLPYLTPGRLQERLDALSPRLLGIAGELKEPARSPTGAGAHTASRAGLGSALTIQHHHRLQRVIDWADHRGTCGRGRCGRRADCPASIHLSLCCVTQATRCSGCRACPAGCPPTRRFHWRGTVRPTLAAPRASTGWASGIAMGVAYGPSPASTTTGPCPAFQRRLLCADPQFPPPCFFADDAVRRLARRLLHVC